MAGRIPRIEPTGNKLTTQAPEIKQDASLSKVSGSVFQDMGNTVADVSDQMMRFQAVSEEAQATNYRQIKINEILSRMDTEDLSTLKPADIVKLRKRYHDDIAKATSESSEYISLPETKSKYMLDKNYDDEVAKVKINNAFLSKQKDIAKGNLEILENSLRSKYISANSTLERESAILGMDKYLENLKSAGLINFSDVSKYKINMINNWNKEKLLYDAQVNPSETLSELEKKDNGIYAGMPPEIVQKGIEQARTAELKRNRLIKEKSNIRLRQSENNAWIQAHDGKLSQVDLETMLDSGAFNRSDGTVDIKFYNSLKKMISSYDLKIEGDKSEYKSLIKLLSNPENFTDDTKYKDVLLQITQGVNSKLITQNDAKNLSKLLIVPYDDKLMTLEDVIQEKANRKGLFEQLAMGFKFVYNMANSAFSSISDASDVMSNSIKDIASSNINVSEWPKIIKENIRKRRLVKHPEFASYSENGTMIVDQYGNVDKAFPDGSLESDNSETKGGK